MLSKILLLKHPVSKRNVQNGSYSCFWAKLQKANSHKRFIANWKFNLGMWLFWQRFQSGTFGLLGAVHKWRPIFSYFFDQPTYPSPILSYYRHPILVYSVRFWKTYLPKNRTSFMDVPLWQFWDPLVLKFKFSFLKSKQKRVLILLFSIQKWRLWKYQKNRWMLT